MTTKTRKVSIPTLYRLAVVQPKTFNEEDRTVEVIFTTGARVRRFNFFRGEFIEELGLKKSEVRMGRLQNRRAPFLDTHGFTDKQGVRTVLGVIESAELIPNKEGRATVRFSKRSEVEDIFRDVQDGILTNISVGYITHRTEQVGEDDNGLPIFRAVDWEPTELSLVPAGADADSFVRSQNDNAEMHECIIVEKEDEQTRESENTENEDEKKIVAKIKQTRDNAPTGDTAMNEEEKRKHEEAQKKIRLEATAAEKTRQKDIFEVVAKVGLKRELAETYISEDKTIDEVRTLVIDALAKTDNNEETQTRASHDNSVGEDLGRKGRIEGMTSAILHRYRPNDEETVQDKKHIIMKGYKLAESGRNFAFLSLLDMARACLEASGVKTGGIPRHRLADMVLAHRAGIHSTSDFSEILANVVNKTLRTGYLAAPKTWGPLTREVFVDDFKEISRTNLGDAEKLEKIEEGSEIKRGTISEAAEKYQVEEYAKIISLSRKTIVNDDLDAMTRLPERMGRRAADLESDTLWDIVKANANLADGNALFSAAHGNLSTVPAAPAEVGLSELRKLMRRQVGLDGAEISLTPVWIFVPPEHETAAEKLIASIVPDSSTNISPFSASGRTPLRLDVEPRLETGDNGSTTAWYGSADKGQVDMLELARLTGTNGPQTMQREGFDVNGIEIKIMHDIGAKAIEHRGLFKNAGA